MMRLWLAAVVALATGSTCVVVAFLRFDQGHVMDLVVPVGGLLAAWITALGLRYVTEPRRRRHVTNLLTQYVPPEVARQLLDKRHGSDLPSGTVTFLFTVDWELLGTLVSRLRMAWVRQRCHDAPSRTASMAPLSPSWASETTSCTAPTGDQAAQEGQPASAVLGGDHVQAEHLTAAVGIAAGGDHTGHVHDAPALAHFLGQGVQPEVGVGPGVEGTASEGLTVASRVLARRDTWERLMPSMPSVLTMSSTRRVDTPSP